jgi:hypothetical protein
MIELGEGEMAIYNEVYTPIYSTPEALYDVPQTNKIDIFYAGLVCAEKGRPL